MSLEDTPRSDSSSEGGGSIADADHEISALENLWPSAQLCSSCISVSTDKPSPAALLNSYDPSLYNEQNVLDFLQNAYIPPAK